MSSAETGQNSIFSTLLASIGFYWQPKEASQALNPIMDDDVDLCAPETSTIVRCKDGAYQLGRVLGTGADSTVREGLLVSSVPSRSEFKVALKIIDKPKRRPDQLDRTRFEAAVGQLFRHPNVIEVLEVIESSRFLILVLPFAANGDLLDFLNRRRRFPEADAARAILQICHALEYAHSNHVIHHDVKLENVLRIMSDDGTERLVLADWGYSQHHIPGRRLRKSYGSLHYSAPEVAAGTGYYGPEIDIWGVGVILFALLYGRLPFDGENDHTTRTRIIAAQYNFPADSSRHAPISASAKSLVASILVADRQQRPTFEQIRAHHWFAEVLGDDTTALTCVPVPLGKHRITATAFRLQNNALNNSMGRIPTSNSSGNIHLPLAGIPNCNSAGTVSNMHSSISGLTSSSLVAPPSPAPFANKRIFMPLPSPPASPKKQQTPTSAQSPANPSPLSEPPQTEECMFAFDGESGEKVEAIVDRPPATPQLSTNSVHAMLISDPSDLRN